MGVFFFSKRGVELFELLPVVSTMTTDRYVSCLRKLMRKLRCGKKKQQTVLLHVDNALHRTNQEHQEKCSQLWVSQKFHHPPYSPDISLCDFYLFGRLKHYLQGKHFASEQTLRKKIRCFIHEIPKQEFAKVFENLTERLELCIASEGEYVK